MNEPLSPLTLNPRVPLLDLRAQQEECEEEIRAAVEAVLHDSAFIFGRFVRDFEDAFARYCSARYCVGVANGTDALALTLRACGVGRGDRVVTSPFTFAGTAEAICHVGARPVFVDIDPVTYTLSPTALETTLMQEPAVKAILPVHLFGNPADMDGIGALARQSGVMVVEDACQAHGARWREQSVGALGRAGCFSFYPSKNLGGLGDGGAVVTDDATLAQEIRLLANHGQGQKYEHLRVGWNSRLDGMQAAVLAVKLTHLDQWNQRRRHWAQMYRVLLQNSALQLPGTLSNADHVYHLFVVRTPHRDALANFLRERNIEVGLYYPVPLHLQPAFAPLGYRLGAFPVAEACARECLALPLFPHLTDEQVAEVCASIREWSLT